MIGSRQSSVRILHVDDDPDFVAMAAEFLEREDERFEVATATDAETGLDRLRDEEFDCVVSDYDMPGTDGVEFLRVVRAEHDDLPFVLFTGEGSETVASEAVSAGVTEYLQKRSGTDQYALLANTVDNAVAARRSATAARRSQHRAEQMLKTVPACVVQLNRDGEFIYANDRAVEVLGLERDEVTDRAYNDPAWQIRDPEGNPIPDEELPFRRVLDGGEPLYDVRHTIEWPDGAERLLSVNGAPLFDGSGDVESAVFSLTDITDRTERERELGKARTKFQKVFEHANDAILIVDPTADEFLDCNAAAASLLGVSRERLLSDLSPSAVHPASVEDALTAFFDEVFETGQAWSDQVPIRTADGEVRPVEMSAVYLELDGRECVVNHVHDITEYRERERKLERRNDELEQIAGQMERQYHYLFEEAPVMAVVTRRVDGEPVIEDCNGRFAERLGYAKSDLVDRRLAEVYTPDSVRALLDEDGYERALAGEFTREQRELVTADGQVVETSLHAVPRQDGVAGTLGLFVDISDRQRLKRERDRLDEFTSIVSHDLRGPLSVVEGRVELAREECESDHLAEAADGLDRMRTLIEDLLTLAREGREVSETEPVALSTLLEECWRAVATDAATLAVDVGADRRLRADPGRLRQLLENLLRNAVEHGPADGEGVNVRVGVLDDEAGIYVADDGPGVPEDERERVFDAGHSTAEEGTGFGLRIVERVAEAHGWEVRVTTSVDGGARFEVVGVEFAAD